MSRIFIELYLDEDVDVLIANPVGKLREATERYGKNTEKGE